MKKKKKRDEQIICYNLQQFNCNPTINLILKKFVISLYISYISLVRLLVFFTFGC